MAKKVALWINGNSTNLRGQILQDLSHRYVGDNTPLYRAGSSYQPLLEADAVAIFGGDETIRHVFNGLIKARGTQQDSFPQILVLPFGNGNALAHSLGTQNRKQASTLLERTIENDFLATASIPLIHIQAANQDPEYFTFASVGLDVTVINDYDKKWRPRMGKIGYIPAGLSHLPHLKPLEASVEKSQGLPITQNGSFSTNSLPLDDLIKSDTVTFGVGTTPHYGWGLKALPYATQAHQQGMMHARSFNLHGRVAHFLANIPSFWKGEYQGPLVRDAFTGEINLQRKDNKSFPLEVAGDVIGYVPRVSFRIAPQYTFRFITQIAQS